MRANDWRDSMALLPARARSALCLWQQRQVFVGLDIDAERVRLIEMARGLDGLQVTRAAQTVMRLQEEDLEATLTALLRSSGTKARRAATAVPGADVFSKRVVISVPPGGDFEAAIRAAAAACIPEDLANVNLDYQVLGTSAGGRKIDVLLAAARREIVSRRAAVLRAVGLRPVVVDVDGCALANAFAANHDMPVHGTAVLIHVGDRRVTMNVVQAKRSMLAVDLPVAPIAGDTVDDDGDWIGEVVDAVHRAVNFYWPLGGDAASILYLSGAPACTPRLRRELCERMQTAVERLDPFARLRLSARLDTPETRAAAPAYTLAVGLALRGFAEP